ncbi:MAG: homoprotocatechuate degradation operon regulator HpaR [Ilumatobacteraceae bacterium]|jgi:homoprotocatechuate degradation regulator HpaR
MTLRQFSRSLPMALMRAREAVMAEFRPILAAHDVTEQQWRVVRALVDEPDGLGIGELAERTCLLGPSLSRILASLEARGLVSRSSVDHDGRRAVITATRAGLRLFETVSPLSESAYEQLEQRFGAAELDQLHDLLDRLSSMARADEIRV